MTTTNDHLRRYVPPCEAHCIDGWLPIDGQEDEIDDMLYLVPTMETVCHAGCNVEWSMNEDLT